MTRVYLHDEIKAILIENGKGWMTASKIAQRVKERGIYKKTERAKTPNVEPFQVRLRAKNKPQMFELDGANIRLS